MVWLALSLRRKMLPLGFLFLALPLSISAQSPGTSNHPWMNRSLSPDQRASLVLKEMTLDEKISMLHGTGMKDLSPISPLAVHSNGGAGYVVDVDERATRETDLLAFEIGLRESDAAAVMCSYNRVNGDYACENKHLLADVLKKDWNFAGFVVSDWQATHSTAKASAAGLDHEEPGETVYGPAMKKAVQSGQVSMAELDDHVRGILRSMFASGVVDDPPQKSVVDVVGGLEVAQRAAEQSIVLLKNEGAQLPLNASAIRSLAVIGAHSDVGMISGGGSAQVDPPVGNAILPPGKGQTRWLEPMWFPTSPLKAIRAKLPRATVQHDAGTDPSSAAALAKNAEVAIVFAYQWESEDMDLDSLALPAHQDELIAKVAAANPHTIVVVESGGAVTMPWVRQVNAIVEAWYAGSKGADAVANVLFGEVNPSAKLPITFPLSDADLPHPTIVKPPVKSTTQSGDPDAWKKIAAGLPLFQISYDEGLKVGYKWYDAEKKPVLFPFGHGLSYTTYSYSKLKVEPGKTIRASFTLQNTGTRDGAEVAEVYTSLPAAAEEPPKRVAGDTCISTTSSGNGRRLQARRQNTSSTSPRTGR